MNAIYCGQCGLERHFSRRLLLDVACDHMTWKDLTGSLKFPHVHLFTASLQNSGFVPWMMAKMSMFCMFLMYLDLDNCLNRFRQG